MAERACAACGAKLSARSKFCPDCGKAVAGATVAQGPGPRAQGPLLPWFIAGVAILALAATIVIATTRGGAPGAGPAAAAPGGLTGQAPDISNMTPREQADRLFNRVMQASTSGDSGQIAFFGPMAVNAYGNITPLDADARLHLGMIQLVMGDANAALAQDDTLQRENATHLFGPLLTIRAGEAANNQARVRQGNRDLLARWDSERAKNLTEYQQHDADLTAARTGARGSN